MNVSIYMYVHLLCMLHLIRSHYSNAEAPFVGSLAGNCNAFETNSTTLKYSCLSWVLLR